ncbi:MAG: oligosaccharide flippase family protein [Ignavibacteriaceae bacterium]|nr:oligosaccharide flippase family protein [Ignavibacteriaceae bacterium]
MQQKPKLFGATAWYGIGNLFVRFVGIILLPLYSNLIPVEEFGIYSLLMSIYAVSSVFYQFGMNSALTNFYLKEDDELKRELVFSTIMNSIVLMGIFFSVIALLITPVLSQKILDSNKYDYFLVLLFIIIFVETISSFILQLFKTKELSRKVVAYLSLGAVLNFVFNLWFVYGLRMQIKGILYAQLISALFVLFVLLPFVRKSYHLKIDKNILSVVVLFSIPLFISGLFSSGIDVADRFILDYFFTKKEVGEYSFAYRLAMVTNIFVISFRAAWTPYSLNRNKHNESAEDFGKVLVKIILIGSVLLFVVSFFADDLFNIKLQGIYLFNSDYKNGLVIIPFIVLGYIFSSIASFYSIYPFVSNKSYHFLISDGIGLAANLILNFLLIPKFGLIGAGISTCISFFISAGYLYAISRDKVKIIYQKKQMNVLIISGLLILALGFAINNFIVQIGLVAAYILIAEFIARIKLTKLTKLLN